MATQSNRLAVTHAPIGRSSKPLQRGESGYKVRSEDEISKVEKSFLKTFNDNPISKDFFALNFTTLFQRPKTQLEIWPLFFHSKEESGIEMQQGLVTLWSNFLIAETLMAAISIQPLVTMPDTTHGWQLKLYGYIWMMSMISDFWGIAVTALFLGYLLGCPNKLAWKWMCKIGWLSRIPSILVLLDTILTFVATTYTCWILYGYYMGIVCIVVEFFFVVTSLKLATILGKAREKVTNKNMQ